MDRRSVILLHKGEIKVVEGNDAVMAAAKMYNRRRRYSHNVSYDYSRANPYMTEYSYHVVTEDKFDCCKDTFKDFTAHLQHCRSAVHIAMMFGVDRVEVLRTARRLRILEALE